MSKGEFVVFASTLNLVLDPPNKRLDRERIRQFSLLVSLLERLVEQACGLAVRFPCAGAS